MARDVGEGGGGRGAPTPEGREERARSFPSARRSRRRRERPLGIEDVARPVEEADDADARRRRRGLRAGRRGPARPGRSREGRRPGGALRRPCRRRSSRAGTRRGSRRVASAEPAAVTAKEMLRSEEPWAIAITLTPAAASDEKTRAAMPGVPAIPSPTTAITESPGRDGHVVDEARGQLLPKGLLERGHGPRRLGLGEREADGALRGGLEDRRDRQALGVDRAEGARGDARARPPSPSLPR